MLWRKKSSSSRNRGMDAAERGSEEEALDLDDEIAADDENLTPAVAEALVDQAQRVTT